MTIALYLDDQSFTAVERSVRRDQATLPSWFQDCWPAGVSPTDQPDEAGAWLADKLRAHQWSSNKCVVAVPRRWISGRLVDLPAGNRSEVLQFAKLQVEAEIGHDESEFIVDILILPQSDRTADTVTVFIASAPVALIESIQQLASAAALKVTHIVTSDSACASHLSNERTPDDTESQAIGIICEYPDRVEMAVVRHGYPCHSHTIYQQPHVPTDRLIRGGWKQLISKAGIEPQSEQLALYSLGLADDAAFSEAPIRHPVFESFRGANESNATALHTCLGALQISASDPERVINFASPKRIRSHVTRTYSLVGVCLLVAICGILTFWNQRQDRLASLDRQLELLRQQRQQLTQRDLQNEATVKEHEALEMWQRENVQWLDVFCEIQQNTPADRSVYYTSMRVDAPQNDRPASIHISGYGRDNAGFASLSEKLVALEPRFRFIPLEVRPNTAGGIYESRFQFEFQLHDPTEQTNETK